MEWIIVGDVRLARYFEQENIWSKTWNPIDSECAIVLDYGGTKLTLSIWESVFNGKCKRFAAKEVSNNVWVFAVPDN